jgi:hypothetical protein
VVNGRNGARSKDFVRVALYLAKFPTAAGLIKTLALSRNTYRITLDPTTKAFEYDSETREILFNPTSGLQLNDGNVQSPALGLAHELSHAVRHETDPKGYEADSKAQFAGSESSTLEDGSQNFVFKYEPSQEEKRATKVEGRIARELGEPSRSVYQDGKSTKVKGPTCSKVTGSNLCR